MPRDPIAYAQRVMEAAQRKDLTSGMASKEYNVGRGSIGSAVVILKHGTDEEKRLASEGRIGIETQADMIRKRLTPEQLKELKGRGNSQKDPEVLSKRKLGSSLWTKLHPALVNLSSMPDARSVVTVIKTHGRREETTDHHLEAAKLWLEEFEHEWKQYKQSKGGNADSGRGSPSVRGQHLKQAS